MGKEKVSVSFGKSNLSGFSSGEVHEDVAAMARRESEEDRWRGVLARVRAAMDASTFILIDPTKIRPLPGQPRTFFSETALASLRESIREVGQIQPGIVRAVSDGEDGVTHELLDGERRWRAVCAEGIPTYRAQLVVIDDEAAPFVVAAIANFNREDHTPIEISDAIHKMRTGSIKLPIKAIAEILGFSEMWTYHMHKLQDLHPDVRAMLDPNQSKERILPLTAAMHISKLHKDLQTGLAERVLAKEISMGLLRTAVIEAGREHGVPVRMRTLEPRKLLTSLEKRCNAVKRSAKDMLMQLGEIKSRKLLHQYSSTRRGIMRAELENALHDLTIIKDAFDK